MKPTPSPSVMKPHPLAQEAHAAASAFAASALAADAGRAGEKSDTSAPASHASGPTDAGGQGRGARDPRPTAAGHHPVEPDAQPGSVPEALPQGISSSARRLPDVDGRPFVVDSAAGAWITDAEGRRHLDFAMAMGATVLGHAHPAVVEACTRALQRGAMPGFTHAGEAAAAQALVRHAGPLVHATFVSTGSEAVHLACRIARRATARPVVAKIAAGYDGWYDDVALGWTGSAEADLSGARPLAQGVTLVRWNDLSDLEALFAERDDIAAVLVEPVLANAGCLMPQPGYLQGLQQLCRRHGALVIADEVLTGMRLHPGPSSLPMDLEPDLVTLGKAIGSGVPVAAVLGTAQAFAPVVDGRVARAGTYHGNPLVTAAVLATCEVLESSDHAALLQRGERLAAGVREAFGRAGIDVSTSGLGSVFSLWFAGRAPTRYEEAKALLQPERSLALHMALRREGVLTMPSGWGRLFLSFAHDDADVDFALAAFGRAAQALAPLRCSPAFPGTVVPGR